MAHAERIARWRSGWVAVRCGQSRLLDVSAHPYHPIDIRTSDHLKSMKYSSTAHCSPQPSKEQFQFPRRPEDPAGFTDPGGISGFRHPAYCWPWSPSASITAKRRRWRFSGLATRQFITIVFFGAWRRTRRVKWNNCNSQEEEQQ